MNGPQLPLLNIKAAQTISENISDVEMRTATPTNRENIGTLVSLLTAAEFKKNTFTEKLHKEIDINQLVSTTVDSKILNNITLLHLATYVKNKDAVELIFQHITDNHLTPLMIFATAEHLIRNNAKVDIIDADKRNTVHHVIKQGHLQVIDTLLKQHPDFNDNHNQPTKDALMFAIKMGYVDIVRFFLEGKQVKLGKIADGITAWHVLAAACNSALQEEEEDSTYLEDLGNIATILRDNNIDIEKDNEGNYPSSYIDNKSSEVYKQLKGHEDLV